MPNEHDSEENDRRDQRRWHLDKRLNVGHLLTTLSIATAVFVWAGKIDTRVSLVEQANNTWLAVQRERDGQQDDQLRRFAAETLEQVHAINAKMDRLVERELNRNGNH